MINVIRDRRTIPLFEAYMLATVRSNGESDSITASLPDGSAGGFVSFVSPASDVARQRRFHAVLPAVHAFDVRRIVIDQDEDYRHVLGDNPALLNGLLPQEAPRWLAMVYELGSDNYIG
jgi:hypothetical protein